MPFSQRFWHSPLDLLATGLTSGSNWGRRSRANDPQGTKPVRHELEQERFRGRRFSVGHTLSVMNGVIATGEILMVA